VWRASRLTVHLCLCKQRRHPRTLSLPLAGWLRHHRLAHIAWILRHNRPSSIPRHHHTSLNTARTHSDTLRTRLQMLQDLHTLTLVRRCTCQPQDHHRHNVLLTTQVNMPLLRHHGHLHTSSHLSILPVPWDRPASHTDTSRTHRATPQQHRHQLHPPARYTSLLCPMLHLRQHQQLGKQRMPDMVARSVPMGIP